MHHAVCIATCLALAAGLGGGFIIDGVSLHLRPRSARSGSETQALVQVTLHSSTNGWSSREIVVGNLAQLESTGWDPKLPTLLLLHGFGETGSVGSVPAILEAFRKSTWSANVVVIDWGNLAGGPWYYTAFDNTDQVAQLTARLIRFLVEYGGANPQMLHLVGFSLGARIAAQAAANVTATHKVGRLTGLDPWFGTTREDRRMPTRVISFVDIIHADAGVLAHRESVGHADFYPNGGISPQPGCELSNVFRLTNVLTTALCSHSRAYQYFAESLLRPGAFLATPCSNRADFRANKCSAGSAVPMGIIAPSTARGNYYLTTNSKSPYGQSDAMFPMIEDNEVLSERRQKLPEDDEPTKKTITSRAPEARLWGHPGVNTLASFVRLAELNLVE